MQVASTTGSASGDLPASVRIMITADKHWQVRWRHYYAVMDMALLRVWPEKLAAPITSPVLAAPLAERETRKRRLHHADCGASFITKHFTAKTAFLASKARRKVPTFASPLAKSEFQSGFYVMPCQGCTLVDGSILHTGHPPTHHDESVRKSAFPPDLSDDTLLDLQRKNTHEGVSVASHVAGLAAQGITMTGEELRHRLRGKGNDLLEATKVEVRDPVLEHLHRQDERDLLRDVWRNEECYTISR